MQRSKAYRDLIGEEYKFVREVAVAKIARHDEKVVILKKCLQG